jgi:hypothetical protein
MKRLSCLLLATFFFLLTAALAEDVWQKKSYTEWSLKDCQKLLEDSPWAQKWVQADVAMFTPGALTVDRTERAAEQNPSITYTAQFRSASPVRQALVRQMQTDPKVEKWTPEQKHQMEEESSRYLAEKFPDRVMVYVTYTSNVRTYIVDMARFWNAQTTETMKTQIYLVRDRDRIPLVSYRPAESGRNAFQVFFPRQYNGADLLTGKEGSLIIEFQHPGVATQQAESNGGQPGPEELVARQGPQHVVIKFNPHKMLVGSEIAY